MHYENFNGVRVSLDMPYSGKNIPSYLNPLVQKDKTYRILSNKYAEKKAKYDNATPQYKETEEYARLGRIVKRLRATLAQMETNMAR